MARRYNKVQVEDPTSKKTLVDREEYNALCALRDEVHEEVKAKARLLNHRNNELTAVNSEQLSRLTRQYMELDHLRACLLRVEDRDRLLTARVMLLEQQAAEAGKLQIENTELKQALTEIRGRVTNAYPAMNQT